MTRPTLSGSLAPVVAILVLCSLWGPAARAQEADEAAADSDTSSAWTYDLAGKLSASQAAYRNWQEGGLNSFAFTSTVDGQAVHRTEEWSQTYQLRLAFGLIDQADREVRKADDLIRAEATLQYLGNGFFQHFNPTISGVLRTQFAKGFNHEKNPYPEGNPRADDELPVQTSAFFSPAFIIESIGLTYESADWYSVRLGGASKQTVVLDEDLRVLYGVDMDTGARVEAGLELAASLDRVVAENIRYESNFNLFFSFNQTEDPPDLVWENLLTMKVNSWLSTDLEVVTLYDKNTIDALQVKEILSLGISFVLI